MGVCCGANEKHLTTVNVLESMNGNVGKMHHPVVAFGTVLLKYNLGCWIF